MATRKVPLEDKLPPKMREKVKKVMIFQKNGVVRSKGLKPKRKRKKQD